MKKKYIEFMKKHWDIILSYVAPLVGFLFTIIAAKNCTAGLACLGTLVFAVIGIIIGGSCLIISIARTLVIKKMRKNIGRWVAIIIPIIIYLIIYGIGGAIH